MNEIDCEECEEIGFEKCYCTKCSECGSKDLTFCDDGDGFIDILCESCGNWD